MRKTLLLLLGMLFMWAGQVNAQWSVDAVETDYTIDFETTVSDVNEGAFDGSGFATAPATGQLDADAWAVFGMSDGDKDFGVENTSGDLARGASTGGETTGGIYSFEVETGNNAIGFQSSGSDFTPGWIGLKLQNNTGETINTVDFSYDVWVLNNDGRSSTFNGEFSLDGTTWIPITGLAFSTVEAADASPVWEKTTLTFSDNIGTEINDGDFLYFRWYSEDNGGSGGRDEIAVDNIILNISNDTGGASFATLPISEDFESGLGDVVLVNDTETNYWMQGALASQTGSCIFVTDNGTDNQYDNGSSSVSHAYVPVNFDGATNVTLSFDWICVGEGGWTDYDYLRVSLVPSDITIEAGTLLDGSYQIGDNFVSETTLQNEMISLSATEITQDEMHLVFTWKNDGSYGTNPPASVDNIMLEEITCPAPTDLALDSNTADEATFSWTENGSTTDWNLIYGDPGFDPLTEGTTIAADANPYTITSLTENYEYDVYVQSNCGAGDLSTMNGPVNFTTDCNTVTSLPFVEDFETSSTTLNCWSVLNNNGDTDEWAIQTSSTYANSGDQSYQMYTDYNGGSNDDYLISPEIELTGNEQLRFAKRVRSSGEPNDFEVLLSTTGTAPADFTETILPLAVYSNTTYDEITVDLSSYTGNVYIAFHVPSGGVDGYYLYIDDVIVEEIPSCAAPTDLALDSNTANEATFSWTENGSATDWNLIYGAPGFNPLTEGTTVAVDAIPYTITGLTPDNEYDVYVQSNCGAGDLSPMAGPVNFTTDEWIELDLTGDDITITWNAPVGTFDPGIIINGAPYNTDGGFFLVQLYDESDNLVTFADVFEEFAIAGTNYSSGPSNRLLADFTATQQSGIWGTAAVSDNAAAGGSLRGTTLDGSLFYGVMFDATVGSVGAVLPGTGDETATMAYTIADDVYGTYTLKADFYVPFRPGAVGSAGYYTVAELEGLESLGSISREIDLGCAPFTSFPFVEMFEDVVPPDCWEEVRTPSSTYGWSSNANGVTGNCARFDSWNNSSGNISELSTPTLDISTLSNPMLEFSYKNPTGGDFSVLLSTDNGATYSNTLFSGLTGTSDWTEMSLDLTPYIGSEVKIAFVGTSNWGSGDAYIYLDDVTVRELSSEADILTFELAEQTAPATIDAGAQTVEIEVGGATDVTSLTPTITVSEAASIAPESGVAQDFTNPVTYTVTAEDGTEKLWEVTVTPAATLSSENDILTFELAEQTEAATIGAGTVDIEVTWDTDVTSLVPTITVSPLATISPESGVAQDFTNPVTYTVTAEDGSEQVWTATVTKELAPLGANCDNPFTITLPTDLPYLDEDQTTCGLGDIFTETELGYYDGGEDAVYEITVNSDIVVNINLESTTTWTGLGLFESCPTTDNMIESSTSSSSSEAIENVLLSAGTYYIIVDIWPSPDCIPSFDLSIEEVCAPVTDINVSDLVYDGALLTWTAGGLETAWNVKVSETSIDPTETQTGLIYDDVVNTTPELDLATMLEESTDYYVYVQADCGSDWTTEFMFTTPAACPQPGNLTANVGVDFAELSWDAFGGSEWYVKVSSSSINPDEADGDIVVNELTTDNPFTVSDLDADETYYFYVQTSCGSDWSDEGMFTTNCEAITSFPYEEGFEDDLNCWTILNEDGDAYEWSLNTETASEGSSSVRIHWNSSGNNDWLISPKIVVNSDNLALDFMASSNSTFYAEKFNILVSTTDLNTSSFTPVVENLEAPADWGNFSYPLAELGINSGDDVYIAIQCVSVDQFYMYVDAFQIRETNSETDFLTYSFPEQTGAADIDYTAYTIDVEVGNGTELTSLVADFTLSTGATADIAGTPQVSGVTANDFSSPVTYTVTAEDGTTTQEWVVTVTEAAINDETDILTYSFPEAISAATIDATEKTVDIEVAWNADVTALVADFTLSYGATAAIAGTDQVSGDTENDFTDPVVYTVTAEDGTTTEDWTVTVTLGDVPMGANCDNPFMVNLPSELPYTHADQTNCGLGDVYEETDMDSYDNGEDAIYEITVTSDVFVNITLDPGTTNYSGIGLFEGCPDSNVLIDDASAGFSNDPISLTGVALTAGTYYIMIDTWSAPDCIDNYTLTITTDPIADYANNTTLTLTPETQNVATGNDANGVLDVVYPTTVSDDMPVDMMTDAMIDLSELTAGAVVELLDDGTSLGTYTVTGSESVWASEAFTGVNRVAANMTEGQSLSWDIVISDLDDGTYNVSATLYLGLDADLTAETNMTEVATDAMEIIVAAPFIDLALLMPDGNAFVCDFTDPQNVPVEIENAGNTTIATGETISFILDVNGSNEITEDLTLNEDLLPGETYETMTTNTIDFSALGTYEWEATILYTGDADMNNNFTTGYTVHFEQEIEFIDAINDTITIASTDWPYTIETDLTLTTDSVLVSTYEWELDGSTETSLTVNEDGWYKLYVTTEFCTTEDSVYVRAFNSIEGITADEFSVYPNPNNGQFMIEMNLVEKQDVLLSIFNSNGQLVREFKFDDIDSFARQIDMNNVAEGLYLIRINAGGNMFNSQVVIR